MAEVTVLRHGYAHRLVISRGKRRLSWNRVTRGVSAPFLCLASYRTRSGTAEEYRAGRVVLF